MVICRKVLLVTVISSQRGFIVSDNPVKFLPAERMTQLGPMLTDLSLLRPLLFGYVYSIVLPVCSLQVHIPLKPKRRTYLDPNTPRIFNSIYGLCASCTPICFSATTKILKTNTGSWVGRVLLRFVLCTYTREAVLAGSGTNQSNYPTRDT